MKVTATTTTLPQPLETRPRSAPAAAQTAPAASDAQVELSPVSATLAETAAAPFDAARVAEIKQAIREGRFAVSPDKIAERLLESVRELLGHAPRA
ncbi:MAG: flagellar biosynthesis anti-sigma factor FlgM [Rhodocyclaceae bacterium]|nr:flagellar biosynthesis anti-sigma factor FlgM [Rhodocyclaceae bacterium]